MLKNYLDRQDIQEYVYACFSKHALQVGVDVIVSFSNLDYYLTMYIAHSESNAPLHL